MSEQCSIGRELLKLGKVLTETTQDADSLCIIHQQLDDLKERIFKAELQKRNESNQKYGENS